MPKPVGAGEARGIWKSSARSTKNPCGSQARGARKTRVTVAALEALERNRDRLDVLKDMRESTIPIMILHGRQDRTVPLSEGERLWQCADPKLSRFHILEDAGHTFQTRHPLKKPSLPLLEAVSKTIAWFKNTLPN